MWTKYVNIFEPQTDIEFHKFLTNCGKYNFFFWIKFIVLIKVLPLANNEKPPNQWYFDNFNQ